MGVEEVIFGKHVYKTFESVFEHETLTLQEE
jgi:hypothetical protein